MTFGRIRVHMRRIAFLAIPPLAACSPTEPFRPEPASTDATRIELAIVSARAPSDLVEFDTISIAAVIVNEAGVETHTGAVTWETRDGAGVRTRGPRVAELQLNAGSNTVSAFFRNSRGVLLTGSLTIQAGLARGFTVVWGSDGSITELPQPANVQALYPRAINNRGEVVGTAQVGQARRAFMWSHALGFRTIGPGPEDYSEGHDINDEGVVAGYRRIGARVEGFLWTADKGFISLNDGQEPIIANGINNSGVVAGIRNFNAVRWSPQSGYEYMPMPASGKCSGTTSIGSAGHVIGWVGTRFDDGWCLYSSPVVWSPDGAVHTIYECSHQIDCALQPTGVNGAGEVVGNNAGRPFRWTKESGFRDLLGDASGIALGVNERGDVAGAIDYPFSLPTVWDRDGRMRDLPLPSGRHSGTAHAINDKGQVVGVVK